MRTIGILGGMGPMATVDLFNKIVANTKADCDQEHIRIIIDNHPQIPSRIDAILKGTESPLPKLIESARLLEDAGANFIVMPCNTAHYWYDDLQKSVNIPIVHMIENAADHLLARQELSGSVMLLATTATIKMNLYQQIFAAKGLEIKVPSADNAELVAKAIDEVKAGHIEHNPYIKSVNDFMDAYAEKGIKVFIGGCTEVPLLFPYFKGNFELYDATLLLAKTAIRMAKNMN